MPRIKLNVSATANRIGPRRVPPFKVTTVRSGLAEATSICAEWNSSSCSGSGGTGDESEEPNVPPRGRHAGPGARERRRARRLLREHLPAAGTGLLDGRRATTTWWFAPLFQQRYPAVEPLTEQMVVADWPIATGGAAMAQMDLMLAVVGRFAGRLAKACANYLLLDGRRSQAPFMAITYLASQDPKMAKAEKWVRDNIARDFAMEELAGAVALAPGHLPGASRRPAAFLRFSSCNGSGWRPRDCCLRPRACRSKKSRGKSDTRSLPRCAGLSGAIQNFRPDISVPQRERLARAVASLSNRVWPSPPDILQIRRPRTHARCRTACTRRRAGCGRKERR